MENQKDKKKDHDMETEVNYIGNLQRRRPHYAPAIAA